MAMTSCERKRLQRASEKGYAKSRECDWRKQGIKNASYQHYLEMIVEQGSMCSICSGIIDATSPLDHSHTTNLVRGVLCQQCNLKLGFIEAGGSVFLKNASEYLKRWENGQTCM